MAERRRTIAGVGAVGAVTAATVIGVVVGQRNGALRGDETLVDALLGGLATVSAVVAGVLILARARRHPVGWLLIGLAASDVLVRVTREVAVWRLVAAGDRSAWVMAAAWMASWAWVLPPAFVVALVAVFPDGRPATSRWRFLPWAVGSATTAVVLGGALHPQLFVDQGLPVDVANPVGLLPAGLAEVVAVGGLVALPVLALLGVASLLLRYRRGTPEMRRRLLLVTVVAAAVGVLVLLPVGDSVVLLGIAALPVAVCVATLRVGLYAVDRVVARALALALLVLVVAASYLLVLTMTGSLVAEAGRGTFAAVVATAVAALALQPAKRRLDRAAHRLVHGRRPSLPEVLAAVADAAAAPVDQLTGRLAQVVFNGLPDAVAVRVEVLLPEGGAVSATFPQEPGVHGDHLHAPVVCGDVLVGEVQAVVRDEASEADRRVLAEVATVCGPALRNVGLHAQLAAHARRLVTAHDEERLRIEADIHDGVQQHLIAAASRLGLARQDTAAGHAALLDQGALHLTAAMRELRMLVQGMRPAILADQGVAAAMRSHGAAMPLDFQLHVTGDVRLPPQIEAALYWCAREALQNATKHAKASHVQVNVGVDTDSPAAFLAVADDGAGFDIRTTTHGLGLRNLNDRIAALGGMLHVESAPGTGTVLTARVPLDPQETATPRVPDDAAPAQGPTPAS